jgi:hypothetical protein
MLLIDRNRRSSDETDEAKGTAADASWLEQTWAQRGLHHETKVGGLVSPLADRLYSPDDHN